MQKSTARSFVYALLTALAVMLLPQASAQIVTAGMTGVVRGSDGKPLPRVAVTATHTPTNASFTATTNDSGRYNFRGIPVGGPYTVTAKSAGQADAVATDITSELGSDIEVDLAFKSEIVTLEKFSVSASRAELDPSANGAGVVLGSERLSTKPTSERSLADMISAAPLVTLRATSGDREESQISAVGQNNRFNSITIDGARINDQFGLNGTGLASFFNPLSLDTIDQLSVQISPYDVRLANFTGASINAVTKSGTNKFHGSAYYYFRGDHLLGQRLLGPNQRERELTNTTIIPRLQRETKGATLGGPIVQNKLFFFLNYEKFDSESNGRDPLFTTPSETAILAKLNQISTAAGRKIDWGGPITGSTVNEMKDKKYIAKIDWNIATGQRLSARLSKTEGEVPQFGNFANSSLTNASVTGGPVTTSSGHFYSQQRVENAKALQLFSQWTPDFKTEIKYSVTAQDQLTPVSTVAPITMITGLTGTNLLTNTPITNGSYVVGTEFNRHGNQIFVDTQQMSAIGDYFWKNFVFTAGAEREKSNFFNLFRNGSYGSVSFRTLADFLADTNASVSRNYYDPAARPVADISKFSTTGLFAQAKWDIDRRLNLNFGLRYEFSAAPLRPALNTALLAATGFKNTGSLDGVTTLSPRVGFNWSVDEDRTMQLRGGVGHFLGRSPWVFFSNSFGNTGVGTFTRSSTDATNPLPSTLTGYLATFDPANPIGTGADNPALRRAVAFNDDKIRLPAVWRANLAVDRKLPALASTVGLELVHSIVASGLRTTDENLKPTTIGADGRQRFAGTPATLANALFPAYTNLYRTSNANVGQSTYASIVWDRPMKNKWSLNASYTRGKATEAQSNGRTTANGQFTGNVVLNQNRIEKGTADFEIRDRVQISLTRQFEFVKKYRTNASLYYEGRTGAPYSWVFGGDVNGDGVSFNDTAAIPSGVNDARFDFSQMPAAQRDAFLAYVSSSEVARYAGGIVPKNAFYEPWVNRLDLKLTQDIPVYGQARLQLFFDFINVGSFLSKKMFGYTELSPFLNTDVFRTRTLTGTTAYGPDGRIRPIYTAEPAGFAIDNTQSRWRIQLGAKVSF
ncbi:MAG: hypothetical protein RLZZ15_147 [Verrucomicrobiota bacterium]